MTINIFNPKMPTHSHKGENDACCRVMGSLGRNAGIPRSNQSHARSPVCRVDQNQRSHDPGIKKDSHRILTRGSRSTPAGTFAAIHSAGASKTRTRTQERRMQVLQTRSGCGSECTNSQLSASPTALDHCYQSSLGNQYRSFTQNSGIPNCRS